MVLLCHVSVGIWELCDSAVGGYAGGVLYEIHMTNQNKKLFQSM